MRFGKQKGKPHIPSMSRKKRNKIDKIRKNIPIQTKTFHMEKSDSSKIL